MIINITSFPVEDLKDLTVYLNGMKICPTKIGIAKELICYDKEFPMETGRKIVTLEFLADVEGKV